MKKIIALLMVLAVASWIAGPSLLVAASPSATTGLTRGTGGGSVPIVKAKWEMNAPYASLFGTDKDPAPGAQFDAPGTYQGHMIYSVCAIATDPDGVADIQGVYADIYYPERIAIHADPSYPDVHPDTVGGIEDEGLEGCGDFIEQNTLIQLSKTNGYNLFCSTIRSHNNNLPVFSEGYDYDEICAADGELMKETAYVFCDDKTLYYEDPAGFYTVNVVAQDKSGNSSDILTNDFEYLPLTKFDKDFSNVSYGTVMLNTHKRIAGDLDFGTGSYTLRNLGNTRLWMKVAQDDMGLGQSSGNWNVKFDARVGNNEADWTDYDPAVFKPGTPSDGSYTRLEDILDLSEDEEMDFSILVKKWPDAYNGYTGSMWLSATPAPFRNCPPR